MTERGGRSRVKPGMTEGVKPGMTGWPSSKRAPGEDGEAFFGWPSSISAFFEDVGPTPVGA